MSVLIPWPEETFTPTKVSGVLVESQYENWAKNCTTAQGRDSRSDSVLNALVESAHGQHFSLTMVPEQNENVDESGVNLYQHLLQQFTLFMNGVRTATRDSSRRRSFFCQECERLESKSVEARALLRDAIAHPANHGITFWWTVLLLLQFLFLFSLTCVQSHLLDFGYMARGPLSSSSGCFYQSLTECCGSTVEPAADKPGKTCMKNGMAFVEYQRQWFDFVFNRSSIGDCREMLLAVGGNRIDARPKCDDFVVVPLNQTKYNNATWNFIPHLDYNSTFADFRSKCNSAQDGQAKCNRFLLLTQVPMSKSWSAFVPEIKYEAIVETEWFFTDSSCRSDLRIVFLFRNLATNDWHSYTLLAILAVFVFAPALLWNSKFSQNLPTYCDEARFRSAHLQRVFSFLLLLVTFAALLFAVAPFPPLSMGLEIFLAFVNGVIAVCLACAALKRLFAKATNAGFSVYTSAASRLAVHLLCSISLFIISIWMFVIMIRGSNDMSHDESREQMVRDFFDVAYLRPYFTLFYLAYTPIGLELLLYLPHILTLKIKVPRVSHLSLIYIFIFVVVAENNLIIPVSLGEVWNTIHVLGPADDMPARMIQLFFAAVLFFIVLEACDATEEERGTKHRMVLLLKHDQYINYQNEKKDKVI